MFEKLAEIEKQYVELENRLADHVVISDPEQLQKIARQRSQIENVVAFYREFKEIEKNIADNESLLKDPEMSEMAAEELPVLRRQREAMLEKIKIELLPKDPNDGKNLILEVRAGTGGDEAALFAMDLFRMYQRYAERQRWKFEPMITHNIGIGGLKEGVALISGPDVYSKLKYEGGVHRVQRVPQTESQGRIHTSAATVAVMPEAEESDIEIRSEDIRIDVYRSSGAGGQHVNTTDSAVRMTHIPTGIVVSCQDERSQIKNRSKAMKVLKSRLLEHERQKREAEEMAARRGQVGSGDRSDKIRTYNFPQSRVSDHRVGATLYRLNEILDGDLDELINLVRTYFQAEALKASKED